MNYLSVFYHWSLKKKCCFPYKNVLLFPLPTQYNVENQKKLQVVVFNIVCGVGGEVIGRWSSIHIWRFCFWYSQAKTGEYSPIFKTACIAKKIWIIINTIASIWGENMLAYLSLNIICSSKLTVFLELRSRKTVQTNI